MIKNDIFCCNDPLVYQCYIEKEKSKLQEALEEEDCQRKKKKKRKEQIDIIRSTRGTNFQTWKLKELKLFLQYKKKGNQDLAMPKTLPELQQRACDWQADKDRVSPVPSPVTSPINSDNENNNDVNHDDDDDEIE